MAAIDPIIQDCCSILNLFEDIKVNAISRNQNSVAHELVQMSNVVASKNWVGLSHTKFLATLFLFLSNESICTSKKKKNHSAKGVSKQNT